MGVWVCEPRSNEAARCMLRACAHSKRRARCWCITQSVSAVGASLVGRSVACLQPLFPAFVPSLARSFCTIAAAAQRSLQIRNTRLRFHSPSLAPSLWFACIAANKVFNMARGVVGGIGIG